MAEQNSAKDPSTTKDTSTMTEIEKVDAGLEYRYDDPEVAKRKDTASLGCAKLNACDPLDAAGREAAARELLGSAGEGLDIQPGFHCDYGKNIHVGKNFTANFNVTILDGARVTFGDYCMVGPGCIIATTGHPMVAEGRRERRATSKPITFGNDVWLGGNVTVTGGVTIGDNVVIGAGAVVTKDIPSDSLALGVPAKVVRKLKRRYGEE